MYYSLFRGKKGKNYEGFQNIFNFNITLYNFNDTSNSNKN